MDKEKEKEQRVVDVFINGSGEVCILFFNEGRLDLDFNARVHTMNNNDQPIGSVVQGIVTFPLEEVGVYPEVDARI